MADQPGKAVHDYAGNQLNAGVQPQVQPLYWLDSSEVIAFMMENILVFC
jgi:hypothetical protein